MEISSAEFTCSYPKVSACPADGPPEFAFIGRSNVGKSSLINMLTGKKGLAKVSGTPGKTRLINFFLINKAWNLVDLPGYGFARVSKSEQQTLSKMINGYLREREQLALVFVLIDSNIPTTKIDLAFIDQLGDEGIPVAIIFTKADRVSKVLVEKNVNAFLAALSETWEVLPAHFVSSSERRTGREEILGFIGQAMRSMK